MNKKKIHICCCGLILVYFLRYKKLILFNIWALSWPYLQDIFSIKETMSECNMRVHMSSCSITLLTMIKIREHIS